MRRIGPAIDDHTAKVIENTYKSLNFGATRAIESWMPLRRAALKTLKGKFTAEELEFLIVIQKAFGYEPLYAATAEMLDLRVRQSFGDPSLSKKVLKLGPGEAMILCDWVDCYIRADDPEMLKELI